MNVKNVLYYISWEGTTDQGPYILELHDVNSADPGTQPHRHNIVSTITPIMKYVTNADKASRSAILANDQSPSASLPFTSAYSLPSFLPTQERGSSPDGAKHCSSGLRNSILSAARNEGGIDDALVNALGSISMKPNRSKALIMSHEQKSKRILQHCSSWTQLDDAKANRGVIHGQGRKWQRPV